ncbi:MAG: dihydroneopterin triphosphate diphosphatase [Variovorax sp.]
MFKIPQSVLVVIHTRALDVLLLRRVDGAGDADFWQSVTGSKDTLDESLRQAAAREVFEETGIACGAGMPLAPSLVDWSIENVYDIYPQWRSRYAPHVTRNTEHLFGLCLAEQIEPTLSPREHDAWQWLALTEAADRCFSPSNAEAILLLPQFLK